MNLSGDSIRRTINYYKIPEENILVVYDDMDTPKQEIRIKTDSGAGGHNGMKSVLSVIENFTRLKIGIGRCRIDDERARIDYVTSKISEEERNILKVGSEKAADAIIDILKTDIVTVMNKYNRREHKEEVEENKVEENKENNEEEE